MRMSVAQSCRFGLDFHAHLKETERATITDKLQLKDIYNAEFRYRAELITGPNFSALLFALKVSRNATVRKGKVRFNSKAKPPYQDQWRNSSRPSARHGPVSASSPPPPGPGATGAQAQRTLANHLMLKLKEDRAQYVSDKNGVVISSNHNCEDGIISLSVEDDTEHVMRLSIRNDGPASVCFTYYTLLHWIQCFRLDDERKVTRKSPLTLAPGDDYEIQVVFRSTLVGCYHGTLAFEFRPDPSSAAFHIVRYLEVDRGTPMSRELAPVSVFMMRPVSALPAPDFCRVVDGQPPDSQSLMRLKTEVELKKYNVPPYMTQLVDALNNPGWPKDPSTAARKAVLESSLTTENYTKKLQLLLYLEEMQMLVDIKRYSIPSVDGRYATMRKHRSNKRLLVLEVPGVAENRPSVLRGDRIVVRPRQGGKVKYCGYVHAVELESVSLGFSSELLDIFVDNMEFSVEFTVSRLTVRLQHRAAELATQQALGAVLFPAPPPRPRDHTDPEPLPSLSLFDRQLEQNPEQYKAVQHIVAGSSQRAPYLVFGPPGTGKTVTLVEAIKQIQRSRPASCHILACAPSNSAADLLCKKIVEHVDKRLVYRMYALSFDHQNVPVELQACCNLVGSVYAYPSKEELMEYSILVTTLYTAGRFITGGIKPGHFSHVFVDEAGHAVETECIIPLAGLLEPQSGQVVLAGDPKQLGPILRSPLVKRYKMDKSLLERLMETEPLYRKTLAVDDEVGDDDAAAGAFDPRFVTKLLCNYRSHPAILKIPNELFYDEELLPRADEMLRSSFCRWEHLPKMDFPVIFHGVMGKEEREASSPSFFNRWEVDQLMDYVKKLMEKSSRKGRAKLSAKDIGIIAPYRKQVLKIRKSLRSLEKELSISLEGLKVGSVEEFQGQERTVVLVSTVRSDPRHTDLDQKFALGFVKNEKRFNVAVTRAKALLVVVGNPRVLCADPVWKCFIQHCKDNGGYTGFSYHEEEEDVVARLAALWVSAEPRAEKEAETEESALQQLVEPEWRKEL